MALAPGGLLLLGALLVLAYKAATRVLPLPHNEIEQARRAQKRPDPQAQLLEYYRQYPDRYLRVVDESWAYDPISRNAFHSFTLRNIANIAYTSIEVSFSYESAGGKNVLTRTVKIPGSLAAMGSMNIKKIKVAAVPATVKNVVTTVAKAVVVQ